MLVTGVVLLLSLFKLAVFITFSVPVLLIPVLFPPDTVGLIVPPGPPLVDVLVVTGAVLVTGVVVFDVVPPPVIVFLLPVAVVVVVIFGSFVIQVWI